MRVVQNIGVWAFYTVGIAVAIVFFVLATPIVVLNAILFDPD